MVDLVAECDVDMRMFCCTGDVFGDSFQRRANSEFGRARYFAAVDFGVGAVQGARDRIRAEPGSPGGDGGVPFGVFRQPVLDSCVEHLAAAVQGVWVRSVEMLVTRRVVLAALPGGWGGLLGFGEVNGVYVGGVVEE